MGLIRRDEADAEKMRWAAASSNDPRSVGAIRPPLARLETRPCVLRPRTTHRLVHRVARCGSAYDLFRRGRAAGCPP